MVAVVAGVGGYFGLQQPAAPAGTQATPTPTPAPAATTPTLTPTPTLTITPTTPTPTPSSPTLTPMQTPKSTPSPTPVEMETPAPEPSVQELALLENYAATSFFPKMIIVSKDIPVKIYFSRLHREHVNKFAIEPFFSTTDAIYPGEVATIDFLPDRAGAFSIRNVGHGFEATLFVAENEQEAISKQAEQKVQEFALIYSLDEGRIFPEQIIIQKDIPVKVYNLGIDSEYLVAVAPFTLEAVNIDPKKITTFEFTPNETGTFAIRDQLHGLETKLTVK